MGYKKSEFNFIQQNRDCYIIYNTLYNSLVRMNDLEYSRYNNLINNNDEFSNLLVDNGLWVDSELDEKAKYIACAEAYTLNMPRPLSITITTTLKCNARCAYCYENGVKQIDIREDAELKIIDFIKKHNKSNEVHLIWFGGEPLLNTSFIDSLCSSLIKEGIIYSSYIITNGSLLNKTLIETKFDYWNIKDMQVTLDGTKEVYENIKNYKHSHEGEFYSILNNIRIAAENNVFINIRLNIGHDNKESIIELIKELDKIFAQYNNVVFYPAFLTGEQEIRDEDERIEFVKTMLLSMKNIKKLTTAMKFYSLPRMHACMNGDPESFTIDVNGNIYTCEYYVGKNQHRIGELNKGLFINDLRGNDITFKEECRNCVFLPKCFGGCEANRNNNHIPCMIEKYLLKAYLQIL